MRKVETPEGRSVRLLRVGEQVRHALSAILMRGDVHDETLASHLVSVTEVRMSPDLRHATVFVKPLLGADEDTVIKALMDVQLRTEVPVFSAVLTPQQFHESAAHFEFFRKHFATKGIEVAEACANTLLSLERLRGQVAAGIV